MKNGVVITATDTGAGKTYVSSLIVSGLRAEGIDAVGYKPVACGDRDDARALLEASGDCGLEVDDVNPVFFRNATAPYTAALLEGGGGVADVMGVMEAGARSLGQSREFVLVEGVGGWEVPITKEETFGDFAARLELPVIVVVANKLGCLNHALLTLNAIRARGLSVAGIILNTIADEWDTALITNRSVLEQVSGLPILAELIHGQDFLDLDGIREALGLR